ncbi:MAG: glycosyltransferase family 4 protein [Chloroflexi bacterium]|nr:glycosyltransferase family 4 protein [Chloroflexota bacterium]MBI3338918.1 glycosyltransferase family 4 protein [Chloroflexota bacterium]
MPRICIVPAVDGIGGMSSFRNKFEAGLKTRGIEITHDADDSPDAILVIAGTKNIAPLVRARRRGVRIVQRLDGINWIHRKRNTGLRHFARAEYGNFVLSFIRSRIATHIMYQSEFSHKWWEDWYGKTRSSFSVVHNGVDLNIYRPNGIGELSVDRYRLLIVEGSLGGGYDMGLDNAIELAGTLAEKYGFPMELMVVGQISKEHQAKTQARARTPIIWEGALPRERIPQIDRSAHLLFSADLNAACPNSVIEALACGLPVVAFDTGALNELVVGGSGRLVPYGGDPWKLDPPDIPALAEAAAHILRNQLRFRAAARAQAESALGLDKMMDGYLKALLGE